MTGLIPGPGWYTGGDQVIRWPHGAVEVDVRQISQSGSFKLKLEQWMDRIDHMDIELSFIELTSNTVIARFRLLGDKFNI